MGPGSIRLVSGEQLRAGARLIRVRRQRLLLSFWGGFVAAIIGALLLPRAVLLFGAVWLAATVVTGLQMWDTQCPQCRSPFHITLLRRSWRTPRCLHCGFDIYQQ
jgi:hypothetical protein